MALPKALKESLWCYNDADFANYIKEPEIYTIGQQMYTALRGNCIYRIVFIPKYRNVVLYGNNKKDLVE